MSPFQRDSLKETVSIFRTSGSATFTQPTEETLNDAMIGSQKTGMFEKFKIKTFNTILDTYDNKY